MPNALRFVSEIISARTKVLLTRENVPLTVAIKNQLTQYSYISFATLNEKEVDVIIHAVVLISHLWMKLCITPPNCINFWIWH